MPEAGGHRAWLKASHSPPGLRRSECPCGSRQPHVEPVNRIEMSAPRPEWMHQKRLALADACSGRSCLPRFGSLVRGQPRAEDDAPGHECGANRDAGPRSAARRSHSVAHRPYSNSPAPISRRYRSVDAPHGADTPLPFRRAQGCHRRTRTALGWRARHDYKESSLRHTNRLRWPEQEAQRFVGTSGKSCLRRRARVPPVS